MRAPSTSTRRAAEAPSRWLTVDRLGGASTVVRRAMRAGTGLLVNPELLVLLVGVARGMVAVNLSQAGLARNTVVLEERLFLLRHQKARAYVTELLPKEKQASRPVEHRW